MMKKSTIYWMAQTAILQAEFLSDPEKLEVLKQLMADERLAQYFEEEETK